MPLFNFKLVYEAAKEKYSDESWFNRSHVISKMFDWSTKGKVFDTLEEIVDALDPTNQLAVDVDSLLGDGKKLTLEERKTMYMLLGAHHEMSDITRLAFGGFIGVLEGYREGKCSVGAVFEYFINNIELMKNYTKRAGFFHLVGNLSPDAKRAVWMYFRTLAANAPNTRFGPGSFNWSSDMESKMLALAEQVVEGINKVEWSRKETKAKENNESRLTKIRVILAGGKEPSKDDINFLFDYGTEADEAKLMAVVEKLAEAEKAKEQKQARKNMDMDNMEF